MVTPAPAQRSDADIALRITPGMEVYDTFDHKLGTVAHVHEGPLAPGGLVGANDVVEVKTGFLGLGKHLFIPHSVIRDVTEGGVFVAASRDEIRHHGWDQRPATLAGAAGSAAQAPEGPPEAVSHTDASEGATWEEVAPHYRALCERRYGTDARWERYESRYRFAWELERLPEFALVPWGQAETELRRRWEVLHPDTEWPTAAETVRDAWEHREHREQRKG